MKPAILLVTAMSIAAAADFPQAEISNGVIKAKLYLPDAAKGYYQGTRFDWSGQVASLELNGHNFFGKWFEKYDPKIHDAILGPVEEFLTDGVALGYGEVKPGETFVKIGVGAIRKPDEPRFQQFHTYEIADSGKWTVHAGADNVEFTHELRDTAGYAYVYRKTVRLVKDRPEMVLEHSLRNTGRKTIDTSVYEHNFYVMDNAPTGPGVTIEFPFAVRALRDLHGLAETRGKQFVFLKELQPGGQSVFTELEGYGATARDYDIRVENAKVGLGVRQTGDRPISKLVLWSIRSTPCPEAYIKMSIKPGEEFTWRINYDFYTIEQ